MGSNLGKADSKAEEVPHNKGIRVKVLEFDSFSGLHFHPDEICELFGGGWTLLSALPMEGER